MSTRCNIKITDEHNTVWLYHHCDGYIPNGVGENLLTILNRIRFEGREKSARAVDIANAIFALGEGYLLTERDHGDIQYLYMIDCVKREISVLSLYENKIYSKAEMEAKIRAYKKELCESTKNENYLIENDKDGVHIYLPFAGCRKDDLFVEFDVNANVVSVDVKNKDTKVCKMFKMPIRVALGDQDFVEDVEYDCVDGLVSVLVAYK